MTTLSRLHVRGYRRLVDVDLPMRPFTVIIGRNGVGKTSLLEVLSLLGASAQGQLVPRLSELGGIADVLSRDKARDLVLETYATKGDEEAHAELSWLFVKWAIETGGEPVRAAVSQVFAEMLAPQPAKVSIVTEAFDDRAWHRHGRLTRAEMDSVKRAVLREVITPCAEALLGLAALVPAPNMA